MNFKDFIQQSAEIDSALNIDLSVLQKIQAHVLVFDLDGVLCAHDKPFIEEKLQAHLSFLHEHGINLAVHSNNIFPERKEFIKKHLPFIEYLDCPPKKPNPSHLIYLSQKYKVPSTAVVMIDDRLWTGGLAAFKAKAQFIWITQPLKNWGHAPAKECWFTMIRCVEKLWLGKKRTQEDSNL